jgi:hypothetical protein
LIFKKGDKVHMVWKPMHGFRDIPSMRGEVIATNFTSYEKPRMLVLLENGDHIIQDIEDSRDSWVSFKPDFRVVSSIGRAKGF